MALFAKDMSKKMVVEEGITTEEAIEGMEEDIVISNYHAQIKAAIAVLQSWVSQCLIRFHLSYTDLNEHNRTIEYEQAKEFGRFMQKVKRFCVCDEKSWLLPEHGEERFIYEVIAVFEAVPPGGKVVN
ncbi:hypothetical protein B0H10DRAFT_1956251 [Mycena sp. CBHHK59/15]|nr:hypothetical protein B0H10DRAFT_1956251 [Mycena sp. CBHHK59/15]